MKAKNATLNCPYCNTNNVVLKKNAGYVIILSILLFGMPVPFYKKTYFCFECRREWKNISPKYKCL